MSVSFSLLALIGGLVVLAMVVGIVTAVVLIGTGGRREPRE